MSDKRSAQLIAGKSLHFKRRVRRTENFCCSSAGGKKPLNIDEKSNDDNSDAADTLSVYAASVKEKAGLTLLTDEEMLVLALNEIAHTFTRDERNYR